MDSRVLDHTSCQILAILQNNARIPFKALGKQVGLSAPAVAERIHRLEETGIITRYRAELNWEKLGLPIIAFFAIKSLGQNCQEIRSLLNQSPEVRSCYRVTGSDHYLAKVAVKSVSDLEQVVDRFLPYATVTTSVVLSTAFTERMIDDQVLQSRYQPESFDP
jgi:Lrp/AsnC family leucine-responsive transcriptional regulator